MPERPTFDTSVLPPSERTGAGCTSCADHRMVPSVASPGAWILCPDCANQPRQDDLNGDFNG